MSRAFDVIVVGAGHNGLTAACVLAGRGRSVLVLERQETVGGLAAPIEFHPGYRSPGVLHDTTGVRRWVVDALELERHGLRMRNHPPDVLVMGNDGPPLRLRGEVERAAREISAVSPSDAESYVRYREFLGRVRGVLRSFLDEPPLDWLSLDSTHPWTLLKRALRLRGLGKADMMELLRLPPMCVADWLDEWFSNGPLKAALALPAVASTFAGPRSPGSNANLLLIEGAAGPGVEGEGTALVACLERCARDRGVRIVTGNGARRILVSSDGVRGVETDDGETIEAKTVAASCDPVQTLLGLIPPGAISHRLERRIRGFRLRGTTAQLLLALKHPVFLSADETAEPVQHARTGGCLDELERAFDAVKYASVSDRPILEVFVPDAGGDLAPAGGGVASVLVHFAPRRLASGWDEDRRARLTDRVLTLLVDRVPALGSAVVGRRLLCPATLESTLGLTGGHLHHGEHALDQLLIRPTPECGRYRTPIPGLFLCGSGSHPGGRLTCAPGALAASAILES